MLTTSTLHSPGFWNHMPPAHELHIVMNDGPQEDPPEELTLPSRRVSRSHASAWILVAAVGGTGAALAVVNMHNGKLHEVVAEAKNLGHPEQDAPPDASPAPATTAQASQGVLQPAATAAEESTQVAQADTAATPATRPATAVAQTTPLPPITPAAGRSVSPPPPVAAPRQVATLSTPSSTQTLRDTAAPTAPQPDVMAPASAVTPIAPVASLPPLPASAPVVTPLPAQPPASAPSQSQVASTDATAGDTTNR